MINKILSRKSQYPLPGIPERDHYITPVSGGADLVAPAMAALHQPDEGSLLSLIGLNIAQSLPYRC